MKIFLQKARKGRYLDLSSTATPGSFQSMAKRKPNGGDEEGAVAVEVESAEEAPKASRARSKKGQEAEHGTNGSMTESEGRLVDTLKAQAEEIARLEREWGEAQEAALAAKHRFQEAKDQHFRYLRDLKDPGALQRRMEPDGWKGIALTEVFGEKLTAAILEGGRPLIKGTTLGALYSDWLLADLKLSELRACGQARVRAIRNELEAYIEANPSWTFPKVDLA